MTFLPDDESDNDMRFQSNEQLSADEFSFHKRAEIRT